MFYMCYSENIKGTFFIILQTIWERYFQMFSESFKTSS